MTAHLTIEIEVGSTIEEAASEAQRVADQLGIGAQFLFNGVVCRAVPQGTSSLLAQRQQDEQWRELKAPYDLKFVTSRASAATEGETTGAGA